MFVKKMKGVVNLEEFWIRTKKKLWQFNLNSIVKIKILELIWPQLPFLDPFLEILLLLI